MGRVLKTFKVFVGAGRCPYPPPPIYIHTHTFWQTFECQPVSAAASKSLKGKHTVDKCIQSTFLCTYLCIQKGVGRW